MRKGVKWILIGCSIATLLLAIITFGAYYFYPIPEQKDNTIYYFYENKNPVRNRYQEFIQLAEERLQGMAVLESPVVYTQNLYTEDRRFFESLCKKLDIKKEDQKFPMVIVGENYMSDVDRIREHLRYFTSVMFGVEDTGTVWYYYQPDCKDCALTQPTIEQVILDNPGLSVITMNIANPEVDAQFKERLRELNVPESEQQIPFVDNSKEYLSGQEAIKTGFGDFVKNNCRYGK